ncbi:MAG: hypothetical protein RLY35_151, partial [Bacteroidota bacterium]
MALAFNVTFRVDMTNAPAFTVANVNGTFNNWCGGCAAMTDDNADNVWEITIPLNSGSYEYKFTADGWTSQESLTPGSACTVTNFGYTNRSLTVSGDVVLPVVCWGACASCTSVYPVTFKVDMANVTQAYTQVQLAGSFNGWNPPANAMTDANADGIFETTVSLAPGTYEYKFAADNWNIQENLLSGSSCTTTNFGYTNRTLTVTNTGQVLDAVCWGACVSCSAVVPSYNVTFKVDMTQTTGFTTPELNGTFNNWCGNCAQMTDANSDGIWEVTVSLQAGTYEYKFAHDNWAGSEQLTEGSSCTVTNGGFTNRTITVTGNTVLNPVCYGSCSACVVAVPGCTNSAASNYNPAATTNDGSCLFATTLNVDMTCAGTFTNVYVTGPWCNWCGAETYNVLTDANADGIYTVAVNLAAGNMEYKYMVDNWAAQENLIDDMQAGGTCAPVTDYNNYANRQIVVGTTANDVYGRCSACPAITYNVTFKVDMSQVTSAYTQVQLGGAFNGWNPASNPMTDANGDGIYEVTIALAPGSYEYKFAADNWNISESLVAGSSCTVTNFGYTNRSLTVGSSNVTLDPVCWGACVSCSQVAPYYNVTFNVNMSQVTGFSTPEVNGTFNNWCGNCNPMTDANADGIWEATVSLQSGVAYEYKFSYDNWSGQENLTAGSSCTVTNGGYTNRSLNISAPTVLDVVCFGSCTNCVPVSVPGCTNSSAANYNAAATTDDGSCLFATTFNVDMTCAGTYSTVHVTGPWCGWCGAETYNTLTDANADGIYSVTVNLAAGNVEYKYMVDNWAGQENLIDDMQNGGTCAPVTDYANYANRQGVIGSTFNDVYGRCTACQQGIPGCNDATAVNFNPIATYSDGSCLYATTFNVDMSCAGVNFSNVYVTGPWCGWCGAEAYNHLLDGNADGIYAVVVNLPAGNVEYKYMVDNWNAQENLVDDMQNGATCAPVTDYANYANRQSAAGTVKNDVYGSCSACCLNLTYYVDADGDGQGAGNAQVLCSVPTSGYALNNSDCNDNSAAINTSATEVCGNATDENCDGIVAICADDYSAATNVLSIGQYGTGVQTSVNVNLAAASNSVQSSGSGNDAWYTFTATANAVRIALKGSTTAQDDNDLALYDYVAGASTVLVPLVTEDDVHVGNAGVSADAGNEVLYFDGLTPGNTYAICVSNNNAAPGQCVLTISNLNASTTDIGPYTNYTNNYTSTCQNFKVKYRSGAIAYTIHRWAGASMQGAPAWSYVIGGTTNYTVCQLGRIVGANFTGQSQTSYVSVDVTYSLKDAYGNTTTVTAVAQNVASFTMSSEAALTVRTTDQCPAYKNPVYNTIATNRSVCGTNRYQWEFTLQYPTVGLPSVVNGNLGGVRTLALNAVSGMAAGQRYDVRIQSKHVDNTSVSDFSSASCVRTLGAAGMPTIENDPEVVAVKDNAEGVYAAYPNPFNGSNIRIALSNVEGAMEVCIIDATGKKVHQEMVVSEGELVKDLAIQNALPSGMYQLIFKNNGNVQTLKLMVSK